MGAEFSLTRERTDHIDRLAMDRDKVRCLALLDPFLAGNGLIVTP